MARAKVLQYNESVGWIDDAVLSILTSMDDPADIAITLVRLAQEVFHSIRYEECEKVLEKTLRELR